MEIMRCAIKHCETTLTEEMLNEVGSHQPVVKLRHIMKALKELGQTPYANIIEDLPQSQKVVLCIAMTLSQVSPAWKTITMCQLREYCSHATQQKVLTELTIDNLVGIVTALEDAGLIKVGKGESGMGCPRNDNPYNWPLSLGTQLEDVDCALGETLLQQDFYKRLCEYVRCNNIDNK